jgi:hypothetical protein
MGNIIELITEHVESVQAIHDMSEDLPSPSLACFTYDTNRRLHYKRKL